MSFTKKVMLTATKLCLSGLFISTVPSNAQVSQYIFSQSNTAYVPVTGGTIIGAATAPLASASPESAPMDDYTYIGVPLPFDFTFNGVVYDSVNINTNGWISFGNSTTSTSGAISTPASFNAVAAFSANLTGIFSTSGDKTSGSSVLSNVTNTSLCVVGAPIQGTGIPSGATIASFTASSITISAPVTASSTGTYISFCTGEIRTQTQGTAPNRVFVIQFKGMAQYAAAFNSTSCNNTAEFQIKLSEGGGLAAQQRIEVVYGNCTRPDGTYSPQIGLKGATAADYNNRSSLTNWAATTAGVTISATVTWSATAYPSSGLTYTWIPPTCIAPANLGVSATTINSATLTWTGSSPQYRVEWGPIGFAPGSGTVAITSASSHTASPLASGSPYHFYVRGICIPGADTSMPAGPFIFNTVCDAPTTTGINGSRCGPGSVTLSATSSQPGTIINWYAAPSGGLPMTSGSAFATPSITATTTYYAASRNGNSGSVTSPTIGSSPFYSAAPGWGLRFNTTQQVRIDSLTIKAANGTAGPATIQVKITDPQDVVLYTGALVNLNITNSLTEYIIPVDITILSAGDYKMVMTATGIDQLARESSSSVVSYPYTNPSGAIVITAGSNGVGSTATTTAAYYWFYRWKITTGCEGPRVPVVASVSTAASVTATGASRCGPGTLVLNASSATSGVSFKWYTAPAGGSPVFTGAAYTTPSLATTTTYYIAADNGTCEGARVPAVATVNNIPVLSLGSDTTFCAGNTLTLDATIPNAGTYVWDNAATSATRNVSASGTYYVTATSTDNCSTSDTITVTVAAIPQIALGNDTAICSGDALVLDAGNAGATYLWDDGATTQTRTVNNAGTYFVTAAGGGNCTASDTINVSAIPAPAATISAVNSSGSTYTFTATNVQGTITGYSWDFGDQSATQNGASVNHTYASNGSYTVILTLYGICDTVTVTETLNVTGVVGISNTALEDKALTIAPNPARDKVTIAVTGDLKMNQIVMVNILGQVVLDKQEQGNTTQVVDISRMASGVYMVKVITDKGHITKKLEIIR